MGWNSWGARLRQAQHYNGFVVGVFSGWLQRNTALSRVGNVGLHAHQLQKALEAGRAIGEHLHEVHQRADGGDERRHVQRECDEVDVVDPLLAGDVERPLPTLAQAGPDAGACFP